MNIVNIDYSPFSTNSEKKRHFQALRNQRKVRLRNQAADKMTAFFTNPKNRHIIESGDEDLIWFCLFRSVFGDNAQHDPRWDELFDRNGLSGFEARRIAEKRASKQQKQKQTPTRHALPHLPTARIIKLYGT